MKELNKPFDFFHDLLWADLGERPGRPMAVIRSYLKKDFKTASVSHPKTPTIIDFRLGPSSK